MALPRDGKTECLFTQLGGEQGFVCMQFMQATELHAPDIFAEMLLSISMHSWSG